LRLQHRKRFHRSPHRRIRGLDGDRRSCLWRLLRFAVCVTGSPACSVGRVLGWFAKATPWAMSIALFAVLAGWTWVVLQSVQTKRQPARSTSFTIGLATLVFAAAAVWWHFEREIIHLLR
jgi:hypothetical protein